MHSAAFPRHNASGLPFEILQTPKTIAFLYFYNYFRRIPVDANRKHADDPDPSFFGEELGKWDGDTLVIDSIGFKDEQVWADENGSPHSDALHVVERWTRPDYDHIHVDTLIEDPKFYTRRSTTRGRGSSDGRTKNWPSTPAAKTTSIAIICSLALDRSGPTAHAAIRTPRRCRRPFL